MKYSVVLCTLAISGGNVWKNPGEILETAARVGLDGVDIDAEPDRIDHKRFNEVCGIARSLGLKIPGLVASWGGWHAGEERNLGSTDEAVRSHAVAYAKKCIDLSSTMEEKPVLEICCCPYRPEYPLNSVPLDLVRKSFVKSARELGSYAQEKQVPVALEAINRFEGYAGFMNGVKDSLSVIEESCADNLGVLFDFFHVNIEDNGVSETLRLAGKKLMHVHLADSNRATPGTGHIDFLSALRTLRAMGYQGYLSLDCLPPKPDWKTFLERSVGIMKQFEQVVELAAA